MLSFGLIDDLDWFELRGLFWCCPKVLSVRRTCERFTLEGVAICLWFAYGGLASD